MLNVNKFHDYFNPNKIVYPLHVIGVGALGSGLCVLLARLGITEINIYDMDTVTSHNIANQEYTDANIGTEKVDALEEILQRINPDIKVIKHKDGWVTGTRLDGYVFLGLDNIETRQAIVKDNEYNMSIQLLVDSRMRLEDAQAYAAKWLDYNSRTKLIKSMDFTHAEAAAATPVSACNLPMSIMPTITMINAMTMANFVNYLNGKPLQEVIMANPFHANVITM